MDLRSVAVDDGELEVAEWGAGEPVVFIQTALTADELVPLATHPTLEGGYRRIVYHRRGYAGSSPVGGPGSIARDAEDCRDLLAAIGVERAHVVGFSYSGAVGLQLAASAPRCTHSLALIEPPPVHTPSAAEFIAINERLLRTRQRRGPRVALDEFLGIVIGPGWRDEIETWVPGAASQMERDTTTFFATDLPALLDWRFSAVEAGRIRCPVLHIGGSDSGPLFAEVRALMLEWLPDADDVVIPGAGHSMALTHTSRTAEAVAGFLGRHPIDGRARALS